MALQETNFRFAPEQSIYKGKVRDVYVVGDYFISVASDRISAFDHILPRAIPHKGQVLNQLAAYFLQNTRDIIPNWLIDSPDPNVSIGLACDPIKIEMVIRGCLAGHAWRTYRSGQRELCGVHMPYGMVEGEHFPEPIITPATKAEEGHDEDISRQDILARRIVGEALYAEMEMATRRLFLRGQKMARERGLILVDTKYEFGIYNNRLYLIDEIHTPDSSRYFIAKGYEERLSRQEPQQQLSKEFVREWLMDQGFQGKDGQAMPDMPDEFVDTVSERYIELFEKLVGEKFIKYSSENIAARIEKNVLDFLNYSKL